MLPGINLAILQLREDGYLDTLQKKWWLDGSECGTSVIFVKCMKQIQKNSLFFYNFKDLTNSTPLDLSSVAGVLYILIAGLALSLILTTFKVLYRSKNESKSAKVSIRILKT